MYFMKKKKPEVIIEKRQQKKRSQSQVKKKLTRSTSLYIPQDKKKTKTNKKHGVQRSKSLMLSLSDPAIINFLFKKTIKPKQNKQELSKKVTENISKLLKGKIFYTGREDKS